MFLLVMEDLVLLLVVCAQQTLIREQQIMFLSKVGFNLELHWTMCLRTVKRPFDAEVCFLSESVLKIVVSHRNRETFPKPIQLYFALGHAVCGPGKTVVDEQTSYSSSLDPKGVRKNHL